MLTLCVTDGLESFEGRVEDGYYLTQILHCVAVHNPQVLKMRNILLFTIHK